MTTQWLIMWQCSRCFLVPNAVTTEQWLYWTHIIRCPLLLGLCRNLSSRHLVGNCMVTTWEDTRHLLHTVTGQESKWHREDGWMHINQWLIVLSTRIEHSTYKRRMRLSLCINHKAKCGHISLISNRGHPLSTVSCYAQEIVNSII